MEKQNNGYQDLFRELMNFEKRGIRIRLNSKPASPLQVVSACMIKEDKTYMRDYDFFDNGEIKVLDFCPV